MSFRKRENRRMSDSSMAQRVGYRRTHNLVTAELRKVKARRIADVGCGTGVLTAHLARELKPDLIVGTELSPSLLALATRRGALSRTLNVAVGCLSPRVGVLPHHRQARLAASDGLVGQDRAQLPPALPPRRGDVGRVDDEPPGR